MKKYFIIPFALILSISLSGCFGLFTEKKFVEKTPAPSEQTTEESKADAPVIDKVSKPEVVLVEVPDVTGLTEVSAVSIITSKGLIPTVKVINDENVEKGKVVRTEPSRNTIVNPETVVTVYISDGIAGLSKTVSCYEDSIMLGKLEVKPDFTFKLTVNLYEGFGEIHGTYKLGADKSVICTVSSRNFGGFSGDDVDSFTFHPLSDGSYRLRINDGDYLGALMQNYIFK